MVGRGETESCFFLAERSSSSHGRSAIQQTPIFGTQGRSSCFMPVFEVLRHLVLFAKV